MTEKNNHKIFLQKSIIKTKKGIELNGDIINLLNYDILTDNFWNLDEKICGTVLSYKAY